MDQLPQNTPLQLPQNTPLYEQVYHLIERQIINGHYSVGDKLPTEKEMAKQYQVSRTVIREALKALKEKGWIETLVAKGSFVTQNIGKGIDSSLSVAVRMQPDRKIEDLLQVRFILEPGIAALAAQQASEKDIENLRFIVNNMDSAIKDIDLNAFLKWDSEFHSKIAEATANDIVKMILNSVININLDVQSYHLSHVDGGYLNSQKHHKKILKAIELHDSEEARRCMCEHIGQVRFDIETASPKK